MKFAFSNKNIDSCSPFNQTFLGALLKKHAPLKKKRLRTNHVSNASTSHNEKVEPGKFLFKNRKQMSL